MNKTITLCLLVAVVAVAAGVASASCGHKDTHQGTLKSFDTESNSVVVVGEDGKEVKLTLTAKTKVMDAEGSDSKASDLVGKKVKVVSEHSQVDSIEQIA